MRLNKVYLILMVMGFYGAFYQTEVFGQRPADEFSRRVYHFGQDSIQYRLFVPDDGISSDPFPLILTLHGISEIGTDNNSHIIKYRIAETWAEDSSQQRHPAFIFSPQIHPVNGDLRSYLRNTFLPAVDDILDSLIIEFPIDTTRLYITGFSMGSQMTWGYIYNIHPNRFAAAIPMSGGANQVLNEFQITQTPVWALHGDQDNTISVQTTRDIISEVELAGNTVWYINTQLGDIGLTDETLDSLTAAGVTHIYTEYMGADHNIWSQSYDNLLLHRWLFSMKKQTVPLGVKPELSGTIPALYTLYDNFPNPFNPSTTIEFTLQKSEYTELKIYNILGKEVSNIVSAQLNQGDYSYIFDASGLASGMYFYQLTAGNYREVKKMILIR